MHWTWKYWKYFHTWISCMYTVWQRGYVTATAFHESVWTASSCTSSVSAFQAMLLPPIGVNQELVSPVSHLLWWCTSCPVHARFKHCAGISKDFNSRAQVALLKVRLSMVVLFKGPSSGLVAPASYSIIIRNSCPWCSMTTPSCEVVPYSVGKTYLEVAFVSAWPEPATPVNRWRGPGE